jgi:ATP-binding cassette, subfamily F, member 3
VSHDREFLSGLTNRTIEFRDQHLHEYLGDVNYFLEKRRLDNMRQVEMRSTIAGSPVPDERTKAGANLNSEERKHLHRAVQKAEKRISEIENELKKIELQMSDANFYAKPDSEKVLKQYGERKSELDKVVAEWETALEQLGE